MKKLILSLSVLLSLCCAVSAQVPGGGGSPMVPNAASGVQANLNAAVDPTASNDSTQGYSVGSLWQNSITGRVWVARSVSASAAVWSMLELSNSISYVAGNWYLPAGNFSAFNTGTARAAGTIYCSLGFIKQRVTLGALGAFVSTVSAGGNFQLALYANSANRPSGSALASTASLSTTSSTALSSAINVQVEPGPYWFCMVMDNATATMISHGGNGSSLGGIIGSATLSIVIANQATAAGVLVTGSFGTWPNMTGQTFTDSTSNFPLIGFQVTSSP